MTEDMYTRVPNVVPQYDKFGRQIIPNLPWLPEADPKHDSELFRRVQTSMRYPPLFAKRSWTKGLPHKDTYEYYKPSETIGE